MNIMILMLKKRTLFIILCALGVAVLLGAAQLFSLPASAPHYAEETRRPPRRPRPPEPRP